MPKSPAGPSRAQSSKLPKQRENHHSIRPTEQTGSRQLRQRQATSYAPQRFGLEDDVEYYASYGFGVEKGSVSDDYSVESDESECL